MKIPYSKNGLAYGDPKHSDTNTGWGFGDPDVINFGGGRLTGFGHGKPRGNGKRLKGLGSGDGRGRGHGNSGEGHGRGEESIHLTSRKQ